MGKEADAAMRISIATALLPMVLVLPAPSRVLAEQHMMQPRVPAEKLNEARALTSPLPDSFDMIEKGQALYNGKGTCFNCHGKDGTGNGPLAIGLDPAPRNFHHHGFWRHRTEGEIFWVIKHGSPGTSMIGFGGQLSDEEIWSLIQYERSFSGDHGPGRGMGPHGGGRHMGSQGPADMGSGGEGCCADRDPAR